MPVERTIKNKAFKPPSRASGSAASTTSTSRAKGTGRGRGRPRKSVPIITASSDEDDHISGNDDGTRDVGGSGTTSDSERSLVSDTLEAATAVAKSRKRKSSEAQNPQRSKGSTHSATRNSKTTGSVAGKRGRPRLHGSDDRTPDVDQSINDSDDNDDHNTGSDMSDGEEEQEKVSGSDGQPKRKQRVKGPKQQIPSPLLRTLLQQQFRDKELRVGAEASLLVGKYIETFVREAIARAVYERAEVRQNGADEGSGDKFVQVEDLEKLAPQLLLDF